MVLRCTAKLLRFLGSRPERMTVLSGDDWYANLVWIDRRRCLLLTHAGTLFSVFTPDVRKAHLLPIGWFATSAIEQALAVEDLPKDALGHMDPDRVQVAATASRSVLGFMNDMALVLRFSVPETHSQRYDVASVNRALQRHVHHTGAGDSGYERPIDAARAWAAGAGRLRFTI